MVTCCQTHLKNKRKKKEDGNPEECTSCFYRSGLSENKRIEAENRGAVTRGEGAGGGEEGEMGKGDQLCDDRWKLNFWW